ncbi:MAG: (2Fe-2S)-binding protein [Deltaproteobacteria bacterium]|nr:(2Fe-2S)-binding protein [Deltaproteobacteria bacterium]
MKRLVNLTVNGTARELAVEPRRTLLALLREDLGLTGTKQGCAEGDCGACAVLLDGEPVNACLVLALEAAGCEVLTIEGVAADGTLDPLQQAFIDAGAVQCGFCTPGMVLVARALLARHAAPTPREVRHAIAGNLCRCTGYQKIEDAILLAARRRAAGGTP